MNKETSQPPHWKEDFPIRQGDDAYITLREFLKFLGLTSIAFFVGTAIAVVRRSLRHADIGGAQIIAKVEDVPIGSYKLFRHENEPCILVRLDEDKFTAFSQHCTHLNCPVHFVKRTNQLVCPCHEGYFSAEDGRVLAGPPKRPLTRFAVEVREDKIWILPKEQA